MVRFPFGGGFILGAVIAGSGFCDEAIPFRSRSAEIASHKSLAMTPPGLKANAPVREVYSDGGGRQAVTTR
jgi:hypothetical protein